MTGRINSEAVKPKGETKMESEKKSIKVEMPWVATAKMLCAILEDGSDKAFA